MWIVRLALARPYTFVVMALLILIGGVLTIQRMAVDIFPDIPIPVVGIVWTYSGIAPEEMNQRIVVPVERAITTTVSNVEHQESQSLKGIGLIKVFFQPGTNPDGGGSAAHGHLPDAAASAAARHYAAAHYSLLGLQRADCPNLTQLGNAWGVGPIRCF